MKAAQTISGEIVLETLLEKLMRIVIENAGAQRGFLIMEEKGTLVIKASAGVASDELHVQQSTPVAGNSSISEAIINYVARTRESVVLNNAVHSGQFTSDPYIAKNQPKSVFCTPLIHQGKLDGILYLENNLTTGAFTPDRREVLNLLSTQAAISIENANLYMDLTEHVAAYERFVPHEFLSFLNKKSIIDVRLGEQVEKEMTIMFSDIRAFTTLSEQMSPEENFAFINSYLSQMEPLVSAHEGFIDKYLGDGIMALFPTRADNAVRGSISMLHKLVEYNQGRVRAGYQPIRIGIGLHTGSLILGTIGGKNRMDGTVISDAVNLASRIEDLTKNYGASLLISEQTFHRLEDPSVYAIRAIDRVRPKGKLNPVTIYEVLDGNPPHIIELKQQTFDAFQDGMRLYLRKQFTDAKRCFNAVLQTNPDDEAAYLYVRRCEHFEQDGVPADWEGVVVLEEK
jgi:class 3 adenylate cyclase